MNFKVCFVVINLFSSFKTFKCRNPSIDSDTHFIASNPNQIFCGEVSNDMKTCVRTDIKEQIHYDTWVHVENIYNGLKCIPKQLFDSIYSNKTL